MVNSVGQSTDVVKVDILQKIHHVLRVVKSVTNVVVKIIFVRHVGPKPDKKAGKPRVVNEIRDENVSDGKSYAFRIHRVHGEHDSSGMLNVTVGGVALQMLIDSWATTNVID